MDPSILKFRPATFGLALVCFLLPFMTVSCPGGNYTFSGVDMAFGTTVQGQRMAGEPLILVALALAGVALFVSLKPGPSAARAAAGAGGVSAVLLMVAQSKVGGDAARQGMMQVSFDLGYWLALLGLGSGSILSVLAIQALAKGSGAPSSSDSRSPDDAPA